MSGKHSRQPEPPLGRDEVQRRCAPSAPVMSREEIQERGALEQDMQALMNQIDPSMAWAPGTAWKVSLDTLRECVRSMRSVVTAWGSAPAPSRGPVGSAQRSGVIVIDD